VSASGDLGLSAGWKWAVGGIAFAAITWCLADFLRDDRLPIFRDLLPFVYPYRTFLAEQLRQGQVPLWNPYSQLGIPFLASLHSSVFYPPSVILLIPQPLGFNLFLYAHFLIGASGMAVWSRQRSTSFLGMVVGSLVFAIGGYMATSVTNTAHLQAAVWTPWILFAWRYGGRTSGGWIATALLLVTQLLAGAPEVWISTIGLLTLWSLVVSDDAMRVRVTITARFLGCVGAAFALAAFQLLPTFEYLATSSRAGNLPYAVLAKWSMSPVELLRLLLPHSVWLGSEPERWQIGTLLQPRAALVLSIYAGIGGLCAAIGGIFRDREGRFWAGVAAFAILLALGDHSPVYRALFVVGEPLLGRIRYPEKFLFLFHVAISALAAGGMAPLASGERRTTRIALVALGTFAIVLLPLVLLEKLAPVRLLELAAIVEGRVGMPLESSGPVAADIAYKAERAITLLLAVGALAAMRSRKWIGESTFACLFVAILAVDLASVHRGVWLTIATKELKAETLLVRSDPSRPEPPSVFHYQRSGSHPGLARFLPSAPTDRDHREFAKRSWKAGFYSLSMLHGVRNLHAGDSISDPADLFRALERLPLDRAITLLRRFGVSVVIGAEPIAAPGLEPRGSSEGGLHSYRVEHALPFAHLVSELEVEPNLAEVMARLADPSFPADHRALVEGLPRGWKSMGPDPEGARAVISKFDLHSIVVDVSAPTEQFLVVNQGYFPGWSARVDDQAVEIIRTNGLVQGIVVPAGRHRARFDYFPVSLAIGSMISMSSACGIVFFAAVSRRRASHSVDSRMLLTPGRGRHDARN
jgi:hypothetical protein